MTATSATRVKPVSGPRQGEFIECAACAYEPPRFVPRMRCPKCFGYRSFHRVACLGPRRDVGDDVTPEQLAMEALARTRAFA